MEDEETQSLLNHLQIWLDENVAPDYQIEILEKKLESLSRSCMDGAGDCMTPVS